MSENKFQKLCVSILIEGYIITDEL